MRSILTPREPFTSSKSPGTIKSRKKFCCFLGRGKEFRLRPGQTGRNRAFDNLRGIARDADDPIDLSGFRGEASGFAVELWRSLSEFSHFTGGQNAAAIVGSRREHGDHRVQRRRAGVVAVVDQRRSICETAAIRRAWRAHEGCARHSWASAAPIPQTLAAANAASAFEITCRPGERQLQRHALAALHQHERGAHRAAIFNGLRAKIRCVGDSIGQHPPGSVRRKRRHQRIVRVQHRHRLAPVQPFDKLALRQRNLFHRSEKFQMCRSHARHHPNIRPRNFGQARKFAAPRHPHFQNRRLMRLVQAEQRQRQAVLVVEIPLRLQDAKPRAQQCRQDLFGSGLADAAGDPGNFAAPCFANGAREPFERDESVGHSEAPARARFRRSGPICASETIAASAPRSSAPAT